MNNKNNRIGFVIDNIHSAWAHNIWTPFVKNAVKLNKNLFIFPGGWFKGGKITDNFRNSVYSLVNTENLDGLICWSASIIFHKAQEESDRFHSSFDPLPFITLAHKITGHPYMDFDGYTGMKLLTEHCIKFHGAKKIAFIRGPVSHIHTIHRLRGYEDAMKEAGLPVPADNPLVTDPFDWDDGRVAAAQLFEERKLKPGKDFDTIIGCDDSMALEAIDYFASHGYYVPQDYHALGFDNSLESLLTNSRLSTVKAPYSEMSIKSFQMLQKLMDTGNCLDEVFLPTKPVIRESCGCGSVHYLSDSWETNTYFYKSDSKTLTGMIADCLDLSAGEAQVLVDPIVRIWSEIEKDTQNISSDKVNLLFYRLKKGISRFFHSQKDGGLLISLIKTIYHSGFVSLPLFSKLEPALMQTIFMVRERVEIDEQYKKDRLNGNMNSLKHELMGTVDINSLIQILIRYLPGIGIDTAGIVFYRNDGTSFMACTLSPEGIIYPEEQTFSAKLLVPASLEYLFMQGVFMVQPLFTENESIGYFIHNVSGYSGVVYEELRSTISYALKSIFQFETTVSTEKKMLESIEQSRILTIQKEAAQSASEAKSQFLANVSHEIRTPMNAVLGMSELLLSENLNSRQKRYAEDIKTSAMSLLDIINDILDLSKIQSEKMNLVPVNYDFRTLIDNIGSMMRFLIKDNNIAFGIETRGDIPTTLFGDEVRLRQILLNILGNAVKFTNAGYVRLILEGTEEEIHFFIKDTGIGIKQENLPGLFDAFKQVDTFKNNMIKGTGLGLTITKALVEMMNGRIEVESIYGQGTTFHVVIPRIMGDGEKIQHTVSSESILCSPDTKILVVDDNTINLSVMKGLLRLSNITAFTASGGNEAIEMIRRNQYDVIFMDHMMPEMDGIQTTKIIRELGVKVPIIALTANAVTSAKEMLLASGMDDFISKPIIKEALNEILAKWIPSSKRVNSRAADSVSEYAESEEAEKFLAEVGNIEEISLQIGMERVSDQKNVYIDTLKLSIKEMEKCIRNLNNFLAAEDMKNFTIEAHSMKSTLANLGAMELAANSHELEIASAQMDIRFCASNLQSFSDKLFTLSKKIAKAFAELNQNNDPISVSSELLNILGKMKEAIISMDYEEINNRLKNLEALGPDGIPKNEIEEIKDAVMVMDYDEALKMIQKVLNIK